MSETSPCSLSAPAETLAEPVRLARDRSQSERLEEFSAPGSLFTVQSAEVDPPRRPAAGPPERGPFRTVAACPDGGGRQTSAENAKVFAAAVERASRPAVETDETGAARSAFRWLSPTCCMAPSRRGAPARHGRDAPAVRAMAAMERRRVEAFRARGSIARVLSPPTPRNSWSPRSIPWRRKPWRRFAPAFSPILARGSTAKTFRSGRTRHATGLAGFPPPRRRRRSTSPQYRRETGRMALDEAVDQEAALMACRARWRAALVAASAHDRLARNFPTIA